MGRSTWKRGKYRIDFRHNSLLLPFAFAVATWLAWPIYGAPAGTGRIAPEITGKDWLNSKPLTIRDLKGRVVLVEFWTYG